MFLRPAQLQKGEKEERTLADGGNTKLVVSYGPKKLRLEQVSIPQWVVSNTRIFYNLLTSKKLATQPDVQNYLAYTVKIMELSTRYQWVSVLKYDDEFRPLQATYNYPWSFDSNHLHTVIVEPMYTKPSATPRSSNRTPNPSTQFVATTSEGPTICRNFNSSRGCSIHNCAYEHACNRRVSGGKACSLNHSGFNHVTQSALQQQTKPTTQN